MNGLRGARYAAQCSKQYRWKVASQPCESADDQNVPAPPVEYMLLGDEGHGIVQCENRALFLARAARFLSDRVGHE